MQNKSITVEVVINERSFRRFAVFDLMYRQRRWVSQIIFVLIMWGAAGICFIMSNKAGHAVTLGYLLLVIGLGVPLVQLLSFFKSIKKQVKLHRLEEPHTAYTLCLSDSHDGVKVSNTNNESVQYKWSGIYGAYRDKGCVYLYITKSKAFLLPDECVGEGADELWLLISKMLPAEKLHVVKNNWLSL